MAVAVRGITDIDGGPAPITAMFVIAMFMAITVTPQIGHACPISFRAIYRTDGDPRPWTENTKIDLAYEVVLPVDDRPAWLE
jgi:hypothetical protein